MMLLFQFSLPFKEPVLIFTLVLLVIFFVPLLFRKLNIPGIIGLILAGVIIGPNGINLLLRDSSIILFGTVGLLYIMFLAGLEIDLHDFKKSRNRSLVFGLLTFTIPMILGTLSGYYLLEFSLDSSLLLASMFASHTLLSYPIISKLGIARIQPVVITVGGTIITDTAALLVLAIIARSATGELNTEFWIRLIISVLIFSAIVLFVFPRISRWFFKNVEGEGTSQYIFVLAILFASAFLAELAGIEAIIGAFLAGLAMNRLIPHTSPLMNRIEFVGNALFIPFFLISVGMLVDIRVLFRGPEALFVAATMIVVATTGKWLAAFFSQKIFGYTRTERNIIFGLSNAQAAATLAAVIIGYKLGLLNENVLNGTILMILVTCLISSLVTEKSGRKLAIIQSGAALDTIDLPNRILVPISNPATIEILMDFSILVKDENSQEPIHALAVFKDDLDAREKLILSESMLEKAMKHASSTENEVKIVTRTDLNIASGIISAIKDLNINQVIIGWNISTSAKDRLFGSILDSLLMNTNQMISVCNIINPIITIKKIVAIVPPNAEYEPGFLRWMKNIKQLARQTSSGVEFHSLLSTQEKIKDVVKLTSPIISAKYNLFDAWDDFSPITNKISSDDFLFVISARKSTISYNNFLDNVAKKMAKQFPDNSFVIVFPEQNQEIEILKSLQ
ncbi:MAG TPA: cation:proton antiporter [Bacteroidia bacterium]|nr:cation:proton antiporter [Bacteroidia bacterium]